MNRHVTPEHVNPTDPNRPHTETGAEARQGFLGRPILYVLIGGLALALVFIVGTQIWSATEDTATEPPIGEVSADAGVAPPVTPAP